MIILHKQQIKQLQNKVICGQTLPIERLRPRVNLKSQRIRVGAISLIEYTVLILVIILALIGMRDYLRRAISGKWESSTQAYSFGRQYDPEETVVTP